MGLLFCKIWASGYGDIQLFVPGKTSAFCNSWWELCGVFENCNGAKKTFF